MRGLIFLTVSLIGLAAPAAAQQPALSAASNPAGPDTFWTVSDDRLRFKPAQLSAPRRAVGVEYFEASEFSNKGQGVDNAVKYRSADGRILATLYVYYPSFSHSGVQAIATDQAIRGPRSPNLRPLGTGVAAAAGVPKVALTADYDNYLGEHHSKAAFIKADRWMLKLRVTGPQSRSAEVAAVMSALLEGLRFEGKAQPRPAEPIAAGECKAKAVERPDAQVVAGGGGEALSIGMFDAAGQSADNAARGDRTTYLGRIGRGWCRTLLQVGDRKTTVLQATRKNPPAQGPAGESVLLVLYSDSGGVLEVVRLRKERKYLLLHHDIAEMKVLDSYDALPSLAQIGRLFTGGTATNIRARLRLKPDGSTAVELPGAQSGSPQS
jgi:hypothetical protein